MADSSSNGDDSFGEDDHELDSEFEILSVSDSVSDLCDTKAVEKAWGNQSDPFYGEQDISDSSSDFNENEASTIQEKFLSSFHDSDFTSHWLNLVDDLSEAGNRDVLDQKVLSMHLIQSFKKNMQWFAKCGSEAIQSCPLTCKDNAYLLSKMHLLLCYSINILYYLQLISSSSSDADNHPVIHQITLLQELLSQVKYNEKLLSITEPQCYENTVKKKLEKTGNLQTEGFDESAPVHDQKRAITYQISRNKGLVPNRKKEQRNPRVKHRSKYKKALVKRKSQVLSVIHELEKYGGETSGIRSKLARSVQLN